ncbi:MAG: Tm-1-like ATP-binding domain-containing protein, partial [Alphaproteobacteria bacterium]
MADHPVYVVGTADTKGAELKFLADVVARSGARAITVDIGTLAHEFSADFAAADVAACHPDGPGSVFDAPDRGAAMTAMAEAFERFIVNRDDIGAIVGIGGGGGTSVITTGMRALPIGVPKLMVSTL